MAHQYVLKIFHDPPQKSSGPSSYILNIESRTKLFDTLSKMLWKYQGKCFSPLSQDWRQNDCKFHA